MEPTIGPIGGPLVLESLPPPLSLPLSLPLSSLLLSPVPLLSVTTGAKTDFSLELSEGVSKEDVTGDDREVMDALLLLVLVGVGLSAP